MLGSWDSSNNYFSSFYIRTGKVLKNSRILVVDEFTRFVIFFPQITYSCKIFVCLSVCDIKLVVVLTQKALCRVSWNFTFGCSQRTFLMIVFQCISLSMRSRCCTFITILLKIKHQLLFRIELPQALCTRNNVLSISVHTVW